MRPRGASSPSCRSAASRSSPARAALRHRRVDRAGQHRVAADPERPVVGGDPFGDHRERRLGRLVGVSSAGTRRSPGSMRCSRSSRAGAAASRAPRPRSRTSGPAASTSIARRSEASSTSCAAPVTSMPALLTQPVEAARIRAAAAAAASCVSPARRCRHRAGCAPGRATRRPRARAVAIDVDCDDRAVLVESRRQIARPMPCAAPVTTTSRS